MRIIILSSSTNRSGGTRQAFYQARELATRGHHVSLCLPEDSQMHGMGYDDLIVTLPADRKRWKASIEALFAADGPTVVHAFHNRAVKFVAWHGMFWRHRGVVCCAHRGVMYRPGNPLPYISPGMDAFIANSQACARVLRLFTPAGKLFVVYNGVDDARVTPRTPADTAREQVGLPPRGAEAAWSSSSPAPLVFGFVGQNSPVKGADILIDAFARADVGEARLLMVGVSHDMWRPRCEALGIADRVHLVPHTESVSDMLQLMDAFVLPSRTESLPNTMLEAIRMGLPVIGSAVGGVPELVRGNGLLFPAGDIDALAAALGRMASDHATREAWAAASHAEGERYTIHARVDALEDIYAQLLRRRGLHTA
ncbi:glycosyltransferase family 4 protein [Nitratidesulfovibrio vulgaris]|uniref:Glycosyl transferase, group 1 family protein n=1 Tax=Nitratidesulfovibrio vulgaris (strain ATCC 29579 / DSM 644 / CCUG 34227 / NCIMB 8303 / VKM B-1760 / Hildenborough) TaxID=882 RepID=Q72D69_NITV2|nr:glycosyltransferase family 4 protein [Nitratidesulfovibrio vulgaris]AAS95540.1 glycosyl transferase, group 1 family protein [Nitratidesulfovibrio vulgaris str. Hildenborough]ADP86142.1 glycosyl transferase group 1 [Nitratidesulfovibrio vulgaris RCH1]